MPFTPYHFGPNGFLGLVFKRWLDLPAILFANVAIDIEVLFSVEKHFGPFTHWNFPHQVFHFHTLLIGSIVGAVAGLSLFPFRNIFGVIMEALRLPYKPSALRMTVSGMLGAWLHITVDAVYHWDVQMFWPNTTLRPLWGLLTQTQVKILCVALLLIALTLYAVWVTRALRKKHTDNPDVNRRR
jgi:membrane-bound metal-dependent hydrolase YbcI (DUF457 family)